jgi:type I restriction enzyme S subunit
MNKFCFLGEVCQHISYGVTTSAVERKDGPRLLRITDITGDGVNWDNVPGCKISDKEEAKSKLLDGDIVIARTGGTVGKSFLLKDPPSAVCASYLLRLRPKQSLILSDYLNLFLGSTAYWSQLQTAAQGAAQPNVNSTTLSKLILPVPELSDQRRIAAQLKAQLAEVEKARKAAEEQIGEMNLLYSRHCEVSLNELKEAPRVPLGDLLFDIEAGKSFKTTELPARSNQLGVLKVSAVSWSHFQPQEAKAVAVDYEPDEKHRVKQGDLIISRANTVDLVGAVVRVPQAYPLRLLSDKTLRMVFDEDKVEPDYLLNVLRWPEARAHIEHNATGTSDSMRNISQKTIRSIPVPLIPKKMQRQITRKFDAIKDETGKIQVAVKKSLSELELLPQKLLSQAFEMN